MIDAGPTAGGRRQILPPSRWVVLAIVFLTRTCVGFQFIAVAAQMPQLRAE
jgi:hypothetical protein